MSKYNKYLEKVWETKWLSNRGDLVKTLESRLSKHFNYSSNILLTCNGTIPLQIALKTLGKQGEVITTPFSYIASTSAIIWENCKPIFVDIHPEYLTIDESKIEAVITPKTTCILATHIFGNPCNVDKINKIAKKHNLKVIYDAAHCFNVKYNGESIFNFGDVSTCSFHATKIFHTCEGGAIFCKDKELFHKLFYSHNFGHDGPEGFHGLGINGKLSELHAAMGHAVLDEINIISKSRKEAVDFYNTQLNSKNYSTIRIRPKTSWNHSYYPIIFEKEQQLLTAFKTLKSNNIQPRRYFFPSLNTIDYVNGKEMPISESISKRVICLPLYANMDQKDLIQITSIINKLFT